MNKELCNYPMKFAPIYQKRIWGGNLMKEILHRDTPEELAPVGEAWEISDRPEAVSVIVNGPLAGHTIREVYSQMRRELAGPQAKTEQFPLLIKVIDAGERLSLQVHPDEAACRQLGGSAEPKTEMWYVLAASKGAVILAGLGPRATKQQMLSVMSSPKVEEMLQVYPSVPGDAFFIPSGTLHAIGGGNLILEIQQNSDTTYRVSDWGRVDAEGKSRTLHVAQALESIHFSDRTTPRVAGVIGTAEHNRKFPVVRQCPFFHVDELHLRNTWTDDTANGGSCHLVSAINAPVRLAVSRSAETLTLEVGETGLIPFACGVYTITPLQEQETNVLRTTL